MVKIYKEGDYLTVYGQMTNIIEIQEIEGKRKFFLDPSVVVPTKEYTTDYIYENDLESKIDYLSETKKLFEDIFRSPETSEEDWINQEKNLFEMTGIDYQQLSHDLEVGVQNGYPIEEQKKMIIEFLQYLNQVNLNPK